MDALEAFRRRVAATREVWRPGAARPLPEAHIDEPRRGGTIRREAAAIRGWAMFESGPPARVDVWLDDELVGPARLGEPRPDVEDAFGGAGAAVAGFELVHDFGSWPRDDVTVRAVATGAHGERLDLDSVTARVVSPVPVAPPHMAPVPGPRSSRDGGVRLLVFAHQLTAGGGGQLVLLDLVRALTESHGYECTVVCPEDGPLREPLEDAGAAVHLSGRLPLHDPHVYSGRIDELVRWAADRFDAVLANTVVAFPGVEVATRLGIPALWSIHESYDLPVLWWILGDGVHPEVRLRAQTALGQAAAVVFTAESTLRQYEPHILGGRARLSPIGIDLERLDAARSEFDRPEARRARSIPQDAQVVLCVGTVEPRKGQVLLAQAFGLVATRHPRARLVFLGGRDDGHTHVLSRYVAGAGLDGRVQVVPIVPDAWPWFGLADLVVCASDVESLPRSVVEAMAWETPVLATDVFGLPELIVDGTSGWLCPPRDVRALADALDAALAADSSERARIAAAGRAAVERRHSLAVYAARFAELVEDAMAGDERAAAGGE